MEYPTVYGSTSHAVAKIQEDNSTVLRFTITNEGAYIPKTDISSAYLTLYDATTGELINNRHYISVMDYISDSGTATTFQMNLTADDNLIIGDNDEAQELHIAVIELKATSGANALSLIREIAIIIQGLPFYRRQAHNLLRVTKTVSLQWKVVA